MTDAERRVKLVSEMNGTMANIKSAEERNTKADSRLFGAKEALANIQREHEARDTELRAKYAEQHAALASATAPDARLAAVNALNETLEAIEQNKADLAAKSKSATTDLNNAKSEKGTAWSELNKLRELLEEQQTRLAKLLPSPEALAPVAEPHRSAPASTYPGMLNGPSLDERADVGQG
jgi:chromosome segregation ATPase